MNFLLLLFEANVQALAWMLLHFIWQGIAVAAVLAVARVVLKTPRLRYAIACAALFAMAVLPLATFSAHEANTPSEAAPSGLWNAIPLVEEPTPSTTALVSESVQGHAVAVDVYQSWPASLTANLQDHFPEMVLCWLGGVLLLSLRLLGGGWVSYRLKHTGTSPLPDAWQTRVDDLARRQGIRRGARVVTSSIAAVPMVVGVFRPVILVPVATLLGLTQHQLEAVLIHEFAHVRRYDNLVNLLQRLVETAFFFHPAVWWISSCIRTEREHCCDDMAVAGSDPKLYAGALATLEELRNPVLAAAATGGSLLSRVRRLLALDGEDAREGLSCFTVSNLISILVVLAVAAVALEATQAANHLEEEEMSTKSSEMHSPKVLEGVHVAPEEDRADHPWFIGGAFSTIVDAYAAGLKAAGDEWSVPRVAATFGYPFHFCLKNGAVRHDHNCNIETWLFFDRANDLGWDTKMFQEWIGSNPKEPAPSLAALRKQAWEAVRKSIDNALPAIAWSPYTDKDYADWGMLVGYDDEAKTYAVSHVATDEVYTVPFDGFGKVWFVVIVFTHRTEFDPRLNEIKTLRRAIEFSNGTLYTPEQSENCCAVDAIGFDAYELWLGALASGDFDADAAGDHAWQLEHTRGLAAEYALEVSERLGGEAGQSLMRASATYAEERELCSELLNICQGWRGKKPPLEEVEAAERLLAAALEKEREAVAHLEEALRTLERQ